MATSANFDMDQPSRSAPPFLLAANIRKNFDDTPVLRGIDLSMAQGETVCLLGPSGCGKTTLLRIIAGLEQPDAGTVSFEGRDITTTPVHRRDFGFMFQDYALFPHLSVADNIAFGLRMRNWSGADINARVTDLLDLVELEGYGERKIYELSGGQQQRVALARSLAPKPPLLMLDEPLGSLDRALRDQLLSELRRLLQQLHQTALYVTHDQLEAFAVADLIVLMNEGRIEQMATPTDLYLRPATPFVANFLGFNNLLQGKVVELAPIPLLRTALGPLRPATLPPGLGVGDTVSCVIRPEGARLAGDVASVSNRIQLKLQMRSFRGAHTLLRLESPDPASSILEFELPGLMAALDPGDMISLDVDPATVVVFDSTERLKINDESTSRESLP